MTRTIVLLASLALIGACQHPAASTSASAPAAAPATSTATATATASASTTAAARPSANARPAAITAALIATGDSIFHDGSCRRCHGANAGGSGNGPSLKTGNWLHVDGSYESIIHIVTTGVPADSMVDKNRRFEMRPRGGTNPLLTDEQVRAVAAYVWSLSHQ